ncbi:agamous-like MADS-box protein AGL62 [Senna tora]|uniref:Agamous-like MADS-box protein AGL62 n=1 Tax=Senna tora TaxID=362788 RepID=A0A834WKG5_9FABA|nr:agamous-like MADS-box protein AGL62 [Senna tora]
MVNNKFFSGRQKIPIEKIPKKSNLQVTFSKRRSGLFKKASELCTLCGVEIALVVFSPANKAFSFGHPEVEPIIDRYLARNLEQLLSVSENRRRNSNNIRIQDLNTHLTQVLDQLEIEKKQGKELDQMLKAGQRQFWWERPIEELGLLELEELRISIGELQREVSKESSKILMDQRGNYGTSQTPSVSPITRHVTSLSTVHPPPHCTPPPNIMQSMALPPAHPACHNILYWLPTYSQHRAPYINPNSTELTHTFQHLGILWLLRYRRNLLSVKKQKEERRSRKRKQDGEEIKQDQLIG